MAISKAAKWMPFLPQQPSSPLAINGKQAVLDAQLSFPDEKQFGLENFGNTCYANSVLQALYFCSPFRDLVIQSPDLSAPALPTGGEKQFLSPASPPLPPPRRKSERPKTASESTPATITPAIAIPPAPPTLFSALRSLFVFISKNSLDRGVVAPTAFIDKLRETNEVFRGSMHQDAHEFLNYLLNKIVEEIQGDKNHKDASFDGSGEDSTLSSTAPPTTHSANSDHGMTLVHRLFEGTLTSETRCLTCETVSSRDESFLDLSIDIEQNSSVTACLRQFSASEMLCQRNKFFCDSCCGLQEAEKRMKIKKLPNVLALHLKRFKYQEDVQKYIKLSYRVAFPFELRLFNTVDDAQDPDRLYELFAIVVHIGSGPSHGHYITIVKGPHSWLVFDDHKIDQIKESEIPKYFGDSPSGSAYVLYYQAVDVDPASLGIKANVLSTATAVAATSALNGASLSAEALADHEPSPAVPPGLATDPPSPAPLPAPIPTAAPASAEPDRVLPAHVPAGSPPTSPVIRRPSQSALRVHTVPPSPDLAFHSRMPTPQSPARPLRMSADEPPASPRVPRTRRPSTSQGLVSPAEGKVSAIPPVPRLPDLPYVQVNGKEHKEKEGKEFERKPSLWFKRRSLRPVKDDKKEEKEREKERNGKEKNGKDVGTSSAPSISSVPSQASDATTTTSGSVWQRNSLRITGHSKRLSASYSSPNIAESLAHPPASAPLPPIPPTPITQPGTLAECPPEPSLKASHAAESMSAASSVASSSSPLTAAQSHPPPPPKLAVPSPVTPTANGGPSWHVSPATPITPPSAFPSPSHKKSSPLLGSSKPTSASARPATAGPALAKRSSTLPAVPPPLPSSPVPSDLSDGDPDAQRGRPKHASPAFSHWRPHSAHARASRTSIEAPVPEDAVATPPPAVLLGPPREGGGGLKRAARKLSLTAPIFGLGRTHEKEKEKEKEKKREKHGRPLGTIFGAAAMASAAR